MPGSDILFCLSVPHLCNTHIEEVSGGYTDTGGSVFSWEVMETEITQNEHGMRVYGPMPQSTLYTMGVSGKAGKGGEKWSLINQQVTSWDKEREPEITDIDTFNILSLRAEWYRIDLDHHQLSISKRVGEPGMIAHDFLLALGWQRQVKLREFKDRFILESFRTARST